MYLWDSFILQSFKKILRADPELWGCAIYRPKIAHLSWIKIFWYKPLLFLSSTYWPFSLCKILKKFLEPIKSYEDVPFSGPKWPICPEQNFFGTNHYYYFHLPTGPFHCAKFKKILTADSESWGCPIFGPKMVHLCQTKLSFRKLLISFSSTY